jgi:hypothetical protein
MLKEKKCHKERCKLVLDCQTLLLPSMIKNIRWLTIYFKSSLIYKCWNMVEIVLKLTMGYKL